MKAYCFECKDREEYLITENVERDTIKGISFSMKQRHAFCNKCGSEVLPEEVVSQNVMIAHEAYRKASGSIMVSEIQAILDMYDIGANPLSQLLGWGENTIERQMKHTVPDKEHTEQLKRLFNPLNMVDLLVKKGDRLSNTAFKKAALATIALAESMINSSVDCQSTTSFCLADKTDEYGGEISAEEMKSESSFTVSFSSSPQSNLVASSPFDSPIAA